MSSLDAELAAPIAYEVWRREENPATDYRKLRWEELDAADRQLWELIADAVIEYHEERIGNMNSEDQYRT